MRNHFPLLTSLGASAFLLSLAPGFLPNVNTSLLAQQNSESIAPRERHQADVITVTELRAHTDFNNVYAAVQALHSNWLRLRNADSPSSSASARIAVPDGWRAPAGVGVGIQVYLDDHRVGGLELLQNIPVRSVYSVRHLSGVEAQARYGMGHSAGVIAVATGPAWDRP